MFNFSQCFNKYQVWPATLFQFLILAHCVFEFDTPVGNSRQYVDGLGNSRQ